MSRIQNEKTRAVVKATPLFLRIAAAAVLVVLLISLFVSPEGGFGYSAFAFNSPNQSPSPPDPHGPPNPPPGQSNSPPGQSNSPPGPFRSPPGPFQSHIPPGLRENGNRAGNGASRQISLSIVPDSWVDSPNAKGTIWVSTGFRDDHPTHPGFPASVGYQIDDLQCQDYSFGQHDGGFYNGRTFYALYMTVGNGERERLQSFNPGCLQSTYNSWVLLPDMPDERLINENLLFEVYIEADDYYDTPSNYWGGVAILRGEDIAN